MEHINAMNAEWQELEYLNGLTRRNRVQRLRRELAARWAVRAMAAVGAAAVLATIAQGIL